MLYLGTDIHFFSLNSSMWGSFRDNYSDVIVHKLYHAPLSKPVITCYYIRLFTLMHSLMLVQKTSFGWREVLVDIDSESTIEKRLRFVIAPGPTSASTAYAALLPSECEGGEWCEVCPEGLVIVKDIARRVSGGGAALIADYGEDGVKKNTLRVRREGEIPVICVLREGHIYTLKFFIIKSCYQFLIVSKIIFPHKSFMRNRLFQSPSYFYSELLISDKA